jgi:hypothetical protein
MANKRRQTTQWPTEEGRQHNGKIIKRQNNDLQNITHKTRDRATRTPIKNWDDRMCSVDKLKSSLRTCYGHDHDLVNRYVTFVSQMATDILNLS